MASRPSPEDVKQPQTITLSPPCLTVGMIFFLWMLCWFYSRCSGTHAFQKLQLLSHHHCSKFSPSVDNGSDRGSLDSQSLKPRSHRQWQSDMITFIFNGELATSGDKSDSDRWRRNVGVSSDAGQATGFLSFMQMNSQFRERQPIGVKNLSAALTRHHLECT